MPSKQLPPLLATPTTTTKRSNKFVTNNRTYDSNFHKNKFKNNATPSSASALSTCLKNSNFVPSEDLKTAIVQKGGVYKLLSDKPIFFDVWPSRSFAANPAPELSLQEKDEGGSFEKKPRLLLELEDHLKQRTANEFPISSICVFTPQELESRKKRVEIFLENMDLLGNSFRTYKHILMEDVSEFRSYILYMDQLLDQKRIETEEIKEELKKRVQDDSETDAERETQYTALLDTIGFLKQEELKLSNDLMQLNKNSAYSELHEANLNRALTESQHASSLLLFRIRKLETDLVDAVQNPKQQRRIDELQDSYNRLFTKNKNLEQIHLSCVTELSLMRPRLERAESRKRDGDDFFVETEASHSSYSSAPRKEQATQCERITAGRSKIVRKRHRSLIRLKTRRKQREIFKNAASEMLKKNELLIHGNSNNNIISISADFADNNNNLTTTALAPNFTNTPNNKSASNFQLSISGAGKPPSSPAAGGVGGGGGRNFLNLFTSLNASASSLSSASSSVTSRGVLDPSTPAGQNSFAKSARVSAVVKQFVSKTGGEKFFSPAGSRTNASPTTPIESTSLNAASSAESVRFD